MFPTVPPNYSSLHCFVLDSFSVLRRNEVTQSKECQLEPTSPQYATMERSWAQIIDHKEGISTYLVIKKASDLPSCTESSHSLPSFPVTMTVPHSHSL